VRLDAQLTQEVIDGDDVLVDQLSLDPAHPGIAERIQPRATHDLGRPQEPERRAEPRPELELALHSQGPQHRWVQPVGNAGALAELGSHHRLRLRIHEQARDLVLVLVRHQLVTELRDGFGQRALSWNRTVLGCAHPGDDIGIPAGVVDVLVLDQVRYPGRDDPVQLRAGRGADGLDEPALRFGRHVNGRRGGSGRRSHRRQGTAPLCP
jgi:hypothetical protein